MSKLQLHGIPAPMESDVTHVPVTKRLKKISFYDLNNIF